MGLHLAVMTDTPLHARFLQPRVVEALADTPVVLIHGPRQCGKTTLARQVGDAAGFTYLSFDDDVQRASAQAKLAGAESGFLSALIGQGFKAGVHGRRLGKALAERVAAGGYPAALARATARRRAAWYRNYTDTLVQRDVRDLARISALEELLPWHSNRLSRLIKTPKLHLVDTGLACVLLGVDATRLWEDRALYGQLLETFIYQELRRQASWQEAPLSFHHFRDKEGAEVDVVLESGGKLAGVEVKAAATVTAADFRGLRKLQAATGKRFVAGVVLYDGDAIAAFGEGLYAVPISCLW